MKRHFTATAFVVRGSRTLLHWHRRLQQWMPPGGHIEPDEDPVQAVLREVREETGLVAEVIATAGPLPFAYPDQLPAPYTILVEDIPGSGPSTAAGAALRTGEPHQHIGRAARLLREHDQHRFRRKALSVQHACERNCGEQNACLRDDSHGAS